MGVKGGGGRNRRVRTFSGAVPSLESGKRNQDETAEREETDHGLPWRIEERAKGKERVSKSVARDEGKRPTVDRNGRERREEGIGGGRVWDEEMEGRPIRGREDLSTDDGCADSKG